MNLQRKAGVINLYRLKTNKHPLLWSDGGGGYSPPQGPTLQCSHQSPKLERFKFSKNQLTYFFLPS